ncbi:hypothetical protein GF354_03785 [Candidatus Peregrinibacteria bacterium]|nr:hypothetical protein [Candidatus Peregrinibacteria bacterium]
MAEDKERKMGIFIRQEAPEGGKEEEVHVRYPEAEETGRMASDVIEGIPTRRETRLAIEDETLAKSSKQREILVLDYIRRGRLVDGVEIMAELIDLTPKIFSKGLVSFEGEEFDEKQKIGELLSLFNEVEKEIINEDRQIRDFLEELGIRPKTDNYLDQEWYEKNVFRHLKGFLRPQNPKDRRSPEQFLDGQTRVAINKLNNNIEGDISNLLAVFKQDQERFNLEFDAKDHKNNIKEYIYKNAPKGGFQKLPKMSEYQGETIEKAPDLSHLKKRPNLMMLERDTVPSHGGIMLDGNFGYDESGVPKIPEDTIIIDHHDAFDTATHDTATKLAFDFLKDTEKRKILEDARFQDEEGRPIIMTNNLDSDSILSTWAMLNPSHPKLNEYKEIMRKISQCGDFLLGSKVLEFGATARDYEYILRGYIDSCCERVKELRARDLEEKINQKKIDVEQREEAFRIKDQEVRRQKNENEEIKALDTEMRKISKDRSIPGPEKGRRIGQIKRQISEFMGPLLKEQDRLRKEKEAAKNELNFLKKQYSKSSRLPISPEEDLLVLNHILDIVPDIIEHPFKYQEFIKNCRNSEERVIGEMGDNYRQGDIEILKDPKDKDILIVKPREGKSVPIDESVDGMYFYFRRREDFNRELVVTVEGDSYLMAINTQNMKGLRKYDFNILCDTLRQREAEYISLAIREKEHEIMHAENTKTRKRVKKELKYFQNQEERNTKGQLWRNRTQMIFIGRSLIPENEFLALVHDWKKVQDTKNSIKNSAKAVEKKRGKKRGKA